MKVRIHRGTKQIGGTCVELVASSQRLLLDFGLPLDGDPADESLVPAVTGESLCGTVISHPHIDHYGLLHHLPGNSPVLMGAAGKRIIQAAAPFTGQALPSLDGPCIEDRQTWLHEHEIAINHLHTSGHASIGDLKSLAEALQPKALVPIHSFAADRYQEVFSNVVPRDDGEWWEV